MGAGEGLGDGEVRGPGSSRSETVRFLERSIPEAERQERVSGRKVGGLCLLRRAWQAGMGQRARQTRVGGLGGQEPSTASPVSANGPLVPGN